MGGFRPAPNWVGRDLLRLSVRNLRFAITNAVRWWRSHGFPYPSLSDLEVQRDFTVVTRHDLPPMTCLDLPRSVQGLRVVNAFQPRLWHIPSHGRSVIDCFNDDELLHRALVKAVGFWPNRHCWNASCVRNVLRLLHRTRPGNFRPIAARAIVERYTKPGEPVLDFCAGFGGRLLGTLAARRTYVGIEPEREQVRGMCTMLAALRIESKRATLYEGRAEETLGELAWSSVGLILTSPPYFDQEQYSNHPDQSMIRYPTLRVWLTDFLQPCLEECYRVLSVHGRLVINLADANGHDLTRRFERLLCSHYRIEEILRLPMRRNPAAVGSSFRFEPVYVLRKRARRSAKPSNSVPAAFQE